MHQRRMHYTDIKQFRQGRTVIAVTLIFFSQEQLKDVQFICYRKTTAFFNPAFIMDQRFLMKMAIEPEHKSVTLSHIRQ